MVFLTYQFVAGAILFYVLYYFCRSAPIRAGLLIAFGFAFLWMYGGVPSVAVVVVLLAVTYLCSRSNHRLANTAGIVACIATLLFFKYTRFILQGAVGSLFPSTQAWSNHLTWYILPAIVPLGISFFTFEFIHYLVDVRHGRPPIRRVRDFLAFGMFWPTMVAGPIKRYEQFVPALHRGLSGPTRDDLANGLMRVAMGLVKKWIADDLTGWIGYAAPRYPTWGHHMRWVFLIALSARILLDFSGYSDIAIGFARMLGIKVPENFNWPYLARSPAEFWQRWHMSLSSWIRDYVYIPLGGNRLGPARRVVNGLMAMTLCGFWHGPSWNFAVWGIYHGLGLAAANTFGKRRPFLRPERWPVGPLVLRLITSAHSAVSWAGTLLFVSIGWLLFFYPVDQALTMARQLFRRW